MQKIGIYFIGANRGVKTGVQQFPYSHPVFRKLEHANACESFGAAAIKNP